VNYFKLIKELKSAGHGLMSEGQYIAVAQQLAEQSPCNFLVFGLGQDAFVWQKINEGGRTVFLEDDKDWISKFDNSGLEIYEVEYNTLAKDHEEVGFDQERLKMNLPESVTSETWDIIFVDGPLGHNPPRPYKGPGRMQSISTAYQLLKKGGICVLDDMGRQIESKYAFHFFGKENLLFDRLVENKIGIFKKKNDV
jgi:glucuronoxylan 4-O-methyltransferase